MVGCHFAGLKEAFTNIKQQQKLQAKVYISVNFPLLHCLVRQISSASIYSVTKSFIAHFFLFFDFDTFKVSAVYLVHLQMFKKQ